MNKKTLRINGKKTVIPLSCMSIYDVCVFLNISPKGKIAELNGEIIPESHFIESQIKENDCIELIQFMGGGN